MIPVILIHLIQISKRQASRSKDQAGKSVEGLFST